MSMPDAVFRYSVIRSPRRLVLAMLALLTSLASASAQGRETGFLDRSITFQGVTRRYQVYLPLDYTADRRWPVILFLHGAGERGNDGLRPTATGLAQALRANRERFPALVVFPQVAHPDSFWAGADEAMALAVLDAAMAEFGGDSDRVYLTGVSMGGFGTWRIAAEHPDRFAAIVPIAAGRLDPPPVGSPNPSADPYGDVARRVRHVPTWVFHGERDSLSVRDARAYVEALRRVGADVRYTEYAGGGHDAWIQAYADPALWDWVFAQQRRQ
jgi:predicted peptidase